MPSTARAQRRDVVACANGATAEFVAEGQGPTLVLLHGLQSNLAVWDAVCAHLTGFECVRLNFPGRGGSAGWHGAPEGAAAFYSLAGFADLLHALVRQLVDTRGQTVGIAGWSMGAMVTLEYLRRHGAADLHSVALCSGLSKVAGVADIFHADDDASLLAEISRRSEKAGLTAADPQAVLHCWRSMQHFDCRGRPGPHRRADAGPARHRRRGLSFHRRHASGRARAGCAAASAARRRASRAVGAVGGSGACPGHARPSSCRGAVRHACRLNWLIGGRVGNARPVGLSFYKRIAAS
jgi:pimeloyl-ACP methyl ester carboxylesterase